MGCNMALATLTPTIQIYKHAKVQIHIENTNKSMYKNIQKDGLQCGLGHPPDPSFTVNTHFLLLAPSPKLFSLCAKLLFAWLKTIFTLPKLFLLGLKLLFAKSYWLLDLKLFSLGAKLLFAQKYCLA